MQLFHCISFSRGVLLTVLKDDGGVGFRQILDIITNTFSAHHSFAGEANNTLFRHCLYTDSFNGEDYYYIYFVLSVWPTSKNYMCASLVKGEANSLLLIIHLPKMPCKHHIQCIQWTILKALLATTVRTPYNIPF